MSEIGLIRGSEKLLPLVGSMLLGYFLLASNTSASSAEARQVLEAQRLDELPKPVSRVNPHYPFEMRRAGVDGHVVVGFVVSPKGHVQDAHVIESSHSAFGAPAVAAVSQWRFSPGKRGGRAVEVKMQVPLRFQITNQNLRGWTVDRPDSFPDFVPDAMRWDDPPVLQNYSPPVYPRHAVFDSVSDRIDVVFVVTPSGFVQSTRALSGEDEGLIGAAIAAIETFQFEPAQKNGQPCGAILRMVFDFNDGSESHASISDETKRLAKLLRRNSRRIVESSELDETPKLFSQPNPVLPTLLAPLSRPTEVMVELVLSRNGLVHLPKVLNAEEPALGYAAIQAVRSWQFEIPRKKGKPVDALIEVPVVFAAHSRL